MPFEPWRSPSSHKTKSMSIQAAESMFTKCFFQSNNVRHVKDWNLHWQREDDKSRRNVTIHKAPINCSQQNNKCENIFLLSMTKKKKFSNIFTSEKPKAFLGCFSTFININDEMGEMRIWRSWKFLSTTLLDFHLINQPFYCIKLIKLPKLLPKLFSVGH